MAPVFAHVQRLPHVMYYCCFPSRGFLLCPFSQSGDNNPIVYSTPNKDWPILTKYTSGQVIEISVAITNYHWVSGIQQTLRSPFSHLRIQQLSNKATMNSVAGVLILITCYQISQQMNSRDTSSSFPCTPNNRVT